MRCCRAIRPTVDALRLAQGQEAEAIMAMITREGRVGPEKQCVKAPLHRSLDRTTCHMWSQVLCTCVAAPIQR